MATMLEELLPCYPFLSAFKPCRGEPGPRFYAELARPGDGGPCFVSYAGYSSKNPWAREHERKAAKDKAARWAQDHREAHLNTQPPGTLDYVELPVPTKELAELGECALIAIVGRCRYAPPDGGTLWNWQRGIRFGQHDPSLVDYLERRGFDRAALLQVCRRPPAADAGATTS